MTVQTLKIGRREFVLVAKRDFEKLASQAHRHSEDEYWTRSALNAEARAKARRQKAIPFEQIELEMDGRRRPGRNGRPRRRK